MPDTAPNLGHDRTLRRSDPGAPAGGQRQGGLDYFRAMARGEVPPVPIYSLLDMRVTAVEPGYCRFECETGPRMLNPMGGVHGGVYAVLADSAAGVAAQTAPEPGFVTRTMRLSIDFLRPLTAASGRIVCEARTVKAGRRIVLADAAMTDRQGRAVGRAQGTFAVVPLAAAGPDSGDPPACAEDAPDTGPDEPDDPGATARAAMDRTGRELISMIADGRLPPPPIARTIGFSLDAVGDGEATVVCVPDRRLYNPQGIVHGGVSATLIDSAAGMALHTRLPPGRAYSTVCLACDYFRPVTAETGPVSCTGRLVRQGRHMAVADAAVTDRAGKLYARGTATCAIHPVR